MQPLADSALGAHTRPHAECENGSGPARRLYIQDSRNPAQNEHSRFWQAAAWGHVSVTPTSAVLHLTGTIGTFHRFSTLKHIRPGQQPAAPNIRKILQKRIYLYVSVKCIHSYLESYIMSTERIILLRYYYIVMCFNAFINSNSSCQHFFYLTRRGFCHILF